MPETITQFTGVNSIDGVDIYEGDILKYQYLRYRKQIVVVTDVFWQYQGFYLRRNETKLIDSRVLMLSKSKMEVIGNIYDNTELLRTVQQ